MNVYATTKTIYTDAGIFNEVIGLYERYDDAVNRLNQLHNTKNIAATKRAGLTVGPLDKFTGAFDCKDDRKGLVAEYDVKTMIVNK